MKTIQTRSHDATTHHWSAWADETDPPTWIAEWAATFQHDDGLLLTLRFQIGGAQEWRLV